MYRIVFDIANRAPPYWELAVVAACVIVSALLLLVHRLVGGLSALLAGLLVAGAFAWRTYEIVEFRRLLASGVTQVAEGPIHDFHPMPRAGHGSERFCVSSKCFVYFDNSGPGYHEPQFANGVIRDGLRARIHYIGNEILRFELQQ